MVMYQVLKLDQLHGDDAIVVLVGPVERGLGEGGARGTLGPVVENVVELGRVRGPHRLPALDDKLEKVKDKVVVHFFGTAREVGLHEGDHAVPVVAIAFQNAEQAVAFDGVEIVSTCKRKNFLK